MNAAEAAVAKKQQERETLRSVIAQWNANRLDLFELSEPNEVSVDETRNRVIIFLPNTDTAVQTAHCDVSRTSEVEYLARITSENVMLNRNGMP